MRLDDLSPAAQRQTLEQLDPKKRPRNRKVARGPYKATCYACKEVFFSLAAAERHRDQERHFRFECVL